jgi:hypothetical protein
VVRYVVDVVRYVVDVVRYVVDVVRYVVDVVRYVVDVVRYVVDVVRYVVDVVCYVVDVRSLPTLPLMNDKTEEGSHLHSKQSREGAFGRVFPYMLNRLPVIRSNQRYVLCCAYRTDPIAAPNYQRVSLT